MAADMLGNLLGGEHEEQSERLEESLALSDAFAAAVAADHAGHDPMVARAMTALLVRQVQQIDAESALRLSHLRSQSREGKLRRVGQRIRLYMQVTVALLVSAIALGVIVMVHDAFTSRAVVVEAFETPPALAPAGISGKMVASSVLDALQRLQAATRTVEKGLSVTTAWSTDVQIAVPEAGVSIGDIDRLLHQRLGQDVHIGGDLIEAAAGLSLTVRGDGVPPKTFTAGANDLDKLTTQAAEYVYGCAQPFQFATYLTASARYDEALAFLPAAFAHAGDDKLRSKFADVWGNTYASLNKPAQAAVKYRLALTLDPFNWAARGNLPTVVEQTEGEETAWRESQAMLRAAVAAPPAERPNVRLLGNAAFVVWDLPLYQQALAADAAINGGAGADTTIDGPAIADLYALLHDPDNAARYMAASDPADAFTKEEAILQRAYAALDSHDSADAVAAMAEYWKAWQSDTNLQSNNLDQQCYAGLAFGLAGRLAEAETYFAQAGKWSRCAAFHGDVLAQAGDEAGAARVWQEGLIAAPDLPHIYLHRGIYEAAKGNLTAASADLAAAHARAPHYADPLKAWGDVLLRQGHAPEALAKYDEALIYAPNWTALKTARDATAKQDTAIK